MIYEGRSSSTTEGTGKWETSYTHAILLISLTRLQSTSAVSFTTANYQHLVVIRCGLLFILSHAPCDSLIRTHNNITCSFTTLWDNFLSPFEQFSIDFLGNFHPKMCIVYQFPGRLSSQSALHHAFCVPFWLLPGGTSFVSHAYA